MKFLGTVYYGLEKSCFGFGMLGLGLAHLLLAGIDVWRGGGMPSTECPLVSISDDRTRLIIPVVRRRSRKRQNPEFGDKCFGENTSTFLEKSGRAMIELPLRKSASFFRSFCQVASVTERTVVNPFCWWLQRQMTGVLSSIYVAFGRQAPTPAVHDHELSVVVRRPPTPTAVARGRVITIAVEM